MCSLYNMCNIDIDYTMNYKFMCDHCKNESHSRNEFKNHKKILHQQFRGQRCSLYDKCHIEMEYDMNYKFMCNNCKTRFAHSHKLKEHKGRNHIIYSESKCVYDVTYSHWNGS